MSTNMRRPGLVAIGIAGVSVAAPEAALSAGFQLRELSALGAGNAFAGASARATDLATIYTNPAGMARLSGSQLQGDVSVVSPVINFSGSAGAGGSTYSGGDGGDAGEDAVVPAIYGMWDINPRLKAGIAFTVPFGFSTKYDEDWVGRYFAVESKIENFVLSPSIAWQASDRLSIGAGLQVGHAYGKVSQALNLAWARLPDGMAEINGTDYGYGYTLGMLYEFTPASRVGLSYRSRIDYSLDGNFDVSGVPEAMLSVLPPALAAQLSDSDGKVDITTPDVLSLGAYHELSPKWAVMSEVSWTNWSLFDEFRIEFDDGRPDDVTEENWEDSWFFALGADYRPAEDHTFHFGVAFDETPVRRDTRTARVPDANRYWLSVGYSYDLGARSTANFGYTHIFVDDVRISETSEYGTLDGKYSGSVDIVTASLSYRF